MAPTSTTTRPAPPTTTTTALPPPPPPAGPALRITRGNEARAEVAFTFVGSASTDVDALQRIIDGVRARGFTIGSVPDVVA